MSLDLTKVAAQIGGMVARLKDSREEKQKHLQTALEIARSEAIDLEKLKKKIAASRTTWLVADLVERLTNHYPAPPIPTEFTTIATDGSHIDVDRHRSTRCYLLNIGWAVIYYGATPSAVLDSHPHLYSENEDLVIRSVSANSREQAIEGVLLGIKRTVAECHQLGKLAAEQPADSTGLALLDGSLILWGLEAYPDFVTDALLTQGFLKYLTEFSKLNREKSIALASYISFPRSTDVVNVLRVAICPHQPADCDRYCSANAERECDAVAGVQDRELFLNLLAPGERSGLFISPSKIVREHYGEHQVYFFYLRVEDEVARVEMPRWVVENENLLNLTHTLILDQCRRGHGYPVVLAEAHEQAVVTAADKEEFWQLVESLCLAEKMPTLTSAKSLSKRTRWV